MKQKKNWLEWTVFVIGLILVGGTLAYLSYDALTAGKAPPNLQVVLGKPEPRAGHFIVPVTVINRGDQTSEDARIEVRLYDQGAGLERAELEFPFVPRHARREGWVSFQMNPATAEHLQARVLGYRKP